MCFISEKGENFMDNVSFQGSIKVTKFNKIGNITKLYRTSKDQDKLIDSARNTLLGKPDAYGAEEIKNVNKLNGQKFVKVIEDLINEKLPKLRKKSAPSVYNTNNEIIYTEGKGILPNPGYRLDILLDAMYL